MTKFVQISSFWTIIDQFEDRFHTYYQLHLDTTPRSKLIDTRKNFKSVESAEKYYRKKLKKVLLETLKELEN